MSGRRLDNDSVALLLEKHYPGLLSVLRRRIGDPQLAQDMLNQGIVTALEHHRDGRIADPASVAGYVFACAIRHLSNQRRNFDDRAGIRADVNILETRAAGEPAADAQEPFFAHKVRDLVEQLPTQRDRVIVKRFYLDEEDKELICRDLELQPQQFDRVIHRARLRLKELLVKKGFTKGDFFSVLLVCCP